jgi:quercetin dioxygenase-like cupin family protein
MVCFIFLFLGSAKAQDIKEASVEVLAKTSSSWDGKELPNYPKGKPEITILRIKIPPRTKLPVHEHPVINAGVLLSGELTVYTEDNKKVHLQAGDSIVEVVDTWHYGKNEGNTTAEIIVFYSGVHGRPITIKK